MLIFQKVLKKLQVLFSKIIVLSVGRFLQKALKKLQVLFGGVLIFAEGLEKLQVLFNELSVCRYLQKDFFQPPLHRLTNTFFHYISTCNFFIFFGSEARKIFLNKVQEYFCLST